MNETWSLDLVWFHMNEVMIKDTGDIFYILTEIYMDKIINYT